MKHEIFTEVKDGVITRNRKAMRDVLKHFEGQSIKVTIEKKKKQRSNRQNRYLHGYLFPVIGMRLLELGWDGMNMLQAKNYLKQRFLKGVMINKKTGEYIEYTKDTSKCTTIEINVFIENCIRFSAEELDIVVKYPNEDYECLIN